jgi:hypothetical protein
MPVKIETWDNRKFADANRKNILEVAELIESEKIDGVVLNPHVYKTATTEILHLIPAKIKYLFLTDVMEMDLGPISRFKDLEFLGLGQDRKIGIDFSQFEKLQELRMVFHPKDIIAGAASSLQTLAMRSYKSKLRDLSELPVMPHLKQLELVTPNIQSLYGIENQPQLTDFHPAYCRSLKSISALRHTNVERIDFSSCSKITDWSSLAGMKRLQSIRMSSCGILPSIKFLNECPEMNEFRFVNTIIGDNDLSPLLRLDSVGFFNRRGYSHTEKEIDDIIYARTGLRDIDRRQ